MKISEAARRSGLEASAIRFYESAGVLPGPARTPAGYRDYDNGDVDALRFVRGLRALEFPLDDVREIVELRTSGESPCLPVREAIGREAAAIDSRIAELQQLRTELGRLTDAVSQIEDDWPRACVCHLIESSSS